ncbi:PH and SEC7 domain-containing protein 1-like [Pezoporus flaviventris]|uniref:PH and SEC7 domain-containing protein 1-like n=1 Tax=Pezoporus flaviventris TaxID=889875 RepID=UPI002AAFE73A|nr:PH and SEC7 domain-containing protein 1-like [Pezoporus flaviventris]
MLAWIERLNLAAALLSAPPFPAAVGSQRGPARPLLPAALSRSPPEEQRRSHAAWMERVERELRQRQRHGPGPDPRQHRRDTELLLHERRRYETYVRVLDSWLRGRAEPGWEAEAEPGAAPRAPPALSRARSSPSLGPGPAAAPPPASAGTSPSGERCGASWAGGCGSGPERGGHGGSAGLGEPIPGSHLAPGRKRCPGPE